MFFNFWDWQRGLLKILYELAYKELGPSYLDDPTAAKLRALLREETVSPEEAIRVGLRGEIRLLGQEEPRLFVVNNPDWLVGALIFSPKAIFGYTNLFNTFEGCIVLSEEPGAYRLDRFSRADGTIYIIDVPRKVTQRRSLAGLVVDFVERLETDSPAA